MATTNDEDNVEALKMMWIRAVTKFSSYSLNDMEELFELPSAEDFGDVVQDVYLENRNITRGFDGLTGRERVVFPRLLLPPKKNN